jgi:UDP-2,3-diacylglucosamine pyrophosphatase LpxH
LSVILWVLSDLHLSDDSVSPMFDEDRQGVALERLCERVEAEKGELILLGDVFDLTAMTPPPRGLPAFGRKMGLAMGEAPERPPEVLSAAARRRHPRTIAAIANLARSRAVTVVPGNHDHPLAGPEGRRVLDAAGLERVAIEQTVRRTLADRLVVLQHGHEYDEENAKPNGNGEMLTRVLHHAVVPMLERLPLQPNVRVDPARIVALRPEERMVPILQRWLGRERFPKFCDAFVDLLVDVGALRRVEAWLATPERLREKLDDADDLWERIGGFARSVMRGEQRLAFEKSRPDVLVLGHTHVPDWIAEDGRLYVNLGSWTARALDAVGPLDDMLPVLRLADDARGLRGSLDELETGDSLQTFQSWPFTQ